MTNEYAIGIDVGGTSLKCGLVSSSGEIVHTFLQSTIDVVSETDVLQLLSGAIAKCKAFVPGGITGVGIGFPGIVENNVIIGGADNLPGFEDYPLGALLSVKTGLDIFIDNDANMMGLGELVFGAAKGCSDIVFLTVGTGIGGAVVVNNALYGGYKNRGTELGHIILQYNGTKCSCGSKGCLEAYASVRSLIDYYKSLQSDIAAEITGKIIVERYLNREAAAVCAMKRHFDYLAAGVTSFINVFSPQKILIGGGISEAGDFYVREIEVRVRSLVMAGASQFTSIEAAQLGNKAGLIGCAAKVFLALKQRVL